MRIWQGEDSGKGVKAAPVPAGEGPGGWRATLAGCWWHGGALEGSVAAAMVAGTGALAGLPASAPLLLLAFCGTLLVYHLDRTPALSPEDRFNHPARWQWRQQHGVVAGALAAGAALGALWALPSLRVRTLLAGAVLAVPAAAYALPVFRGRDGGGPAGARRLKGIGPPKPFAVAGAWAAASVLLPALEASASRAALGPVLVLLAGYRFLFVLPNLLLADAADRAGDARAGLRTAATDWPKRRLRCLAISALAAAIASGALALLLFGAPLRLAVDLAGPVLLLALVLSSTHRLVHAANLVMLWPAVTAAMAGLA